jgi:multidrug resistance efflux pump
MTVKYGHKAQLLLSYNLQLEKQEAAIASQQKQIQNLTARLSEQAAQIQKVNARNDLDKAVAEHMALKNP